MQKVEGSSPFSRFQKLPAHAWFFSLRGVPVGVRERLCIE
jgi:hypothetical protein